MRRYDYLERGRGGRHGVRWLVAIRSMRLIASCPFSPARFPVIVIEDRSMIEDETVTEVLVFPAPFAESQKKRTNSANV